MTNDQIPPDSDTPVYPPATGSKGIRQESVKKHNLVLVADRIIKGQGEMSRADLARETGLTRATLSRIVTTMVECGIVVESEPSRSSGGRPAIPLKPAPRTYVAIGVELNADRIDVCLMDLTGRVLAQRLRFGDYRNRSPHERFAQLTEVIITIAAQVESSRLTLVGVGIAIPGLVDSEAGYLFHAPSLRWRKVELAKALGDLNKRLGVPIFFENEAILASNYEYYRRLTKPERLNDFLYITGQAGIASALVLDGEPRRGTHGWSAEIGHVCVNPHGPECACGANGCLEVYSSRAAIMERAGFERRGHIGLLTSALSREERPARKAIASASEHLGMAISSCLNMVDLQDVVLGGVFAQLEDYIFPRLQEFINDYALPAKFSTVSLSTSIVTKSPAARGGAWQSLLHFISDPDRWSTGSKKRLPYVFVEDTPTVYLRNV